MPPQGRAGEQCPGLLPALQPGIEAPEVGRCPQPMPVRGQRDPARDGASASQGRIAQSVEVEPLIGDPRRQRQGQSERDRGRTSALGRDSEMPPGGAP